MPRKIIQIATSSMPGTEHVCAPCVDVYALCDDGTVWEYERMSAYPKWVQLPDIPQYTDDQEPGDEEDCP
jgi:hypothetical protein